MEKSLDISELASGTVGVLGKLSSLNETLCEIRDSFSSSFRDHADSVDSGLQERGQVHVSGGSNCGEKPPQTRYSPQRRKREC